MATKSSKIVRTYLMLLFLSTLASSLIWGINTLFLLDAGLSITQAFAANAFFTAGQVIFEVPTGVVADTLGRRFSYLLGTVTLAATTVLYFVMWWQKAPFWGWAVVSVLLGLGFTFFSGAVEAWLVDGLQATKYTGTLESVFSKGQVVAGATMLTGSVAGGFFAQQTNLGVPYIIRSGLLLLTFTVAWLTMRDVGFVPQRSKTPLREVRRVLGGSIEHGLKKPAVRWVMLAAPFTSGIGFYAFYAMQPYLLELYGNPQAYGVAGLAAAIVAGAQLGGGLLAPYARNLFKRRTGYLITGLIVSSASLLLIGLIGHFWVVIALLVVWAIVFSALSPIRQAYLNALIPSSQRATVLSTDNLLGSAGGVITQPGLGKIADVWSYAASFIVSAVVQMLALPFLLLARKQNVKADKIAGPVPSQPVA